MPRGVDRSPQGVISVTIALRSATGTNGRLWLSPSHGGYFDRSPLGAISVATGGLWLIFLPLAIGTDRHLWLSPSHGGSPRGLTGSQSC